MAARVGERRRERQGEREQASIDRTLSALALRRSATTSYALAAEPAAPAGLLWSAEVASVDGRNP